MELDPPSLCTHSAEKEGLAKVTFTNQIQLPRFCVVIYAWAAVCELV